MLLLVVAGLGWFVWHYVNAKLYAQALTPPSSVAASTHAGD